MVSKLVVAPKDLESQVELTSRVIFKKLREAAQPPGKKGLWLRHLSDRRLAEVYHRLKLGQSSYHIAKIAQSDWGIMKSSSLKSLGRAVRIFRDKTIGLIKIESLTVPKTDPERQRDLKRFRKRSARIKLKLDAMDEMRWMIRVQKERVQFMLEREQLSLPGRGLERAQSNLLSMLDTYIKWEVELGVLDAKPSRLDITMKHRFDGILANTVHGDGARMLSAADRFLELAEKNSLTMELGEDGRYHSPKEEAADACDSLSGFEEEEEGSTGK
jgi:hypothetical protein